MPRNAWRRGDNQLAPVGRQQHHRAAYQRQPFFQQLEHFRQHLPLSVLRGQESSDLGQNPEILLVRVDYVCFFWGYCHRSERQFFHIAIPVGISQMSETAKIAPLFLPQ